MSILFTLSFGLFVLVLRFFRCWLGCSVDAYDAHVVVDSWMRRRKKTSNFVLKIYFEIEIQCIMWYYLTRFPFIFFSKSQTINFNTWIAYNTLTFKHKRMCGKESKFRWMMKNIRKCSVFLSNIRSRKFGRKTAFPTTHLKCSQAFYKWKKNAIIAKRNS